MIILVIKKLISQWGGGVFNFNDFMVCVGEFFYIFRNHYLLFYILYWGGGGWH